MSSFREVVTDKKQSEGSEIVLGFRVVLSPCKVGVQTLIDDCKQKLAYLVSSGNDSNVEQIIETKSAVTTLLLQEDDCWKQRSEVD
ncbi:hypothetical protein M5689_010867 [Euphorbia peplus]|nr:hypothetical protein M5689_010867 [Euphorbia peplus]